MGFLYARLQTWLPYTIQIGINGREWLTRQLDAAGLAYRRHDNCVHRVEDLAQAQRLLDAQLRTNWPKLLNGIRAQVHPAHPEVLGKLHADYYGSLKQSEWASDVLFEKPAEPRKGRIGFRAAPPVWPGSLPGHPTTPPSTLFKAVTPHLAG